MKSSLKDKMKSKMNKMMLSCEEASYLVSKSQHEKLRFMERINLGMHLLGCKICKIYGREISILTRYLNRIKSESGLDNHTISLPDSSKAKLKQSFDNQLNNMS